MNEGIQGARSLLASIVSTCKLNDVDPVAYITETLKAILEGHPQSRIEELAPWNFQRKRCFVRTCFG